MSRLVRQKRLRRCPSASPHSVPGRNGVTQPAVLPAPVDRVEVDLVVRLLRLLVEQSEVQTDLLRVLVGPAVDDDELARVGATFPSALDMPVVVRSTAYPAGAVVRFPRTTSRVMIGNTGAGPALIRLYGVALPTRDGDPEATNPPPTDQIIIAAGAVLQLEGWHFLSRGFLVVTAATLQVIAR